MDLYSEEDMKNAIKFALAKAAEHTDRLFELWKKTKDEPPKKIKVNRPSPMMTAAALQELAANPAYKGIDVIQEGWKFRTWCEKNKKSQTIGRFVNWLNKVV